MAGSLQLLPRSFDPRLRPWHQQALPSPTLVLSSVLRLPIELETLTHLADYKMTRTAVEVTNWVCFGTIMAKGKVSKGDDNWDAPWDQLRVPSHYLAGDIAQPAGSGTLFVYTAVLRLFPDLSAVRQLSALDGPSLVRWWETTILPVVGPVAV